MPITLPTWLAVAFIAAVALTTIVRVLGLARCLLSVVGTLIGSSLFAAMPRPGMYGVPGVTGYKPARPPEPKPQVMTADESLRDRAERIAAVTDNDADVVMAALREGGSFPDAVEEAAQEVPTR